jgi:hypothetical protein
MTVGGAGSRGGNDLRGERAPAIVALDESHGGMDRSGGISHKRAMRSPARASRSFCAGLVLGTLLVACSYIPREVAGLPEEQPWFALPLRSWLAEDRMEPEAVAICRGPECGAGLVASVVRLTGEDARTTQAVLDRPERLVRALERAKPNAKARTVATMRRLQVGASRGFLLVLQREDGTRPPAYGGALGQPAGKDLRVVMVIGGSEEAVEATLRRVAVDHLGS